MTDLNKLEKAVRQLIAFMESRIALWDLKATEDIEYWTHLKEAIDATEFDYCEVMARVDFNNYEVALRLLREGLADASPSETTATDEPPTPPTDEG